MPVRMIPTVSRADRYRMAVLTRLINAEGRPRRHNGRKSAPAECGTTSAYRRGCRCEKCKAHRRDFMKGRRSTPRSIPLHYHGKENTYNYYACRCLACKDAHAAYQKEKPIIPRCHCMKNPRNGKRCHRRIRTDGRWKYCSEECRIAANEEKRRMYFREYKRKKASEAATPAAGRSQLKS